MPNPDETVLEWMARTGEQPSVRELAEVFDCSGCYIRNALNAYLSAGFIWRYRSYDCDGPRWHWRHALKSDPACHRPLRARWPGPGTAIARYRALRNWGLDGASTQDLAEFLGCSKRRVRQIRRAA